MIHGIGVDLVSRARIAQVHQRHGRAFEKKILGAREQRELRARKGRPPAHYLASAFAAKEAFVKALGSGFRGVAHTDVGVLRNAQGKPELVYSRALAARLRTLGIVRAHVALSDEGDLVCAYVVLETAEVFPAPV